MIDLDELERLATAATAGPWARFCGDHVGTPEAVANDDVCATIADCGEWGNDNSEADAAFIAAANPATLLEFVHALREARELRDRVAEAEYLITAGSRCGWCGEYWADHKAPTCRLAVWLQGAKT